MYRLFTWTATAYIRCASGEGRAYTPFSAAKHRALIASLHSSGTLKPAPQAINVSNSHQVMSIFDKSAKKAGKIVRARNLLTSAKAR